MVADALSGTRFQPVKPRKPTTGEIAVMLRCHWSVDKAPLLPIAVGSGGCIRATLADLEFWVEAEELS